jgi:hypothetical protein
MSSSGGFEYRNRRASFLEVFSITEYISITTITLNECIDIESIITAAHVIFKYVIGVSINSKKDKLKHLIVQKKCAPNLKFTNFGCPENSSS